MPIDSKPKKVEKILGLFRTLSTKDQNIVVSGINNIITRNLGRKDITITG